MVEYVKITDLGQMAYVSLLDNDGLYKIKSYNISSGSFILQNNYQVSSNNYKFNEIMLYSGKYIIGLSDNNNNFTTFSLDGSYINSQSVG